MCLGFKERRGGDRRWCFGFPQPQGLLPGEGWLRFGTLPQGVGSLLTKGTVRWGVGCCPPPGVGRPTLVVDAFLCTSVAYADDKVWCGVGVYLLQNFLTLLGLVNTHVVQVVP